MNYLDDDAIARTLLNARGRLCAAFYLLLKDAHAAEDVFQTVTVRALRSGASFTAVEPLLAWAHLTGRRLAIDLLRRKGSRWEPLDEALMAQMDADWAQRVGSSETEVIHTLRECLQELPQHSRRLMEMRYDEGRNGEEIAEILSSKIDAIYQRLSRTHKLLRTCMDGKRNLNEAT
ncbi:hypothetical protein BH11VER1_BH11VER1_07770 [soil metagenome]